MPKQKKYASYLLTFALCFTGIALMPGWETGSPGLIALTAVIALVISPFFYTLFLVIGSAFLGFFINGKNMGKEFLSLKYWPIYLILFVAIIYLLSFPWAEPDPRDIEMEFYREQPVQ